MKLSRSWKKILVAGATLTVAAGVSAGLPASAYATSVHTVLPAPDGPYRQLGSVNIYLIDYSRPGPDEWVQSGTCSTENRAGCRQLMVTVTYPAVNADRYPLAPYMTTGDGTAWVNDLNSAFAGFTLVTPDMLPSGHAHSKAPALPGKLPVVIYDPGYNENRAVGTSDVQELASQGYVVVSLDHPGEPGSSIPGDPTGVDFPDGHSVPCDIPLETYFDPATFEQAQAERVADTRFVLNELTVLSHGGNPDAEHQPMPTGLSAELDLSHLGMFGHSLGGSTAAETMHEDNRVLAGINMDGNHWGAVVNTGLDRPFMLMRSDRPEDPSWDQLWANLRGFRKELLLTNSQHYSYIDLQPWLPQLVAAHVLTQENVTPILGTVNPQQATAAQWAYVNAFFNQMLKGRPQPLLYGPSPFPAVQNVR
jgi:predicted dienelactone hydrolase